MDEMDERLRRDADKIEAPVPPELSARIRATLKSVTPARRRTRAMMPLGVWVAASLSGAAAALLVFLLLPRAEPPARRPEPLAQSAPLPRSIAQEFPLEVRTAELTGPLEEELANLQSDIEKARERVRDDLDF